MGRILYLEKTVKKYYKIANEIKKKGIKKENSLPGNCYFINETDVLCFERKDGVSRHPFSFDGLTIWARSSGYISAIEADKSIFRFIRDGEEPCIAFFGGIKNENGYFDPVSVTGVATCRNDIKAERFSVFTPAAAYYITECKEIIFAVMVSLSAEKNIQFSFCAINLNASVQMNEIMNEAEKLIKENIFNPKLNVKFVAENLFISQSYLYRCAKVRYKYGLSEYIKNEKLKIAKNMIASGCYSFSYISENLNFCSQSYFSTEFKKKFGMTPITYAKQFNIK